MKVNNTLLMQSRETGKGGFNVKLADDAWLCFANPLFRKKG